MLCYYNQTTKLNFIELQSVTRVISREAYNVTIYTQMEILKSNVVAAERKISTVMIVTLHYGKAL